MDQVAILECDAHVTQAQMLRVKAQLAAHGIDAVVLPVGMTLAAVQDGKAQLEDDE